MKMIINIVQIGLALLLIVLITLQAQGGGLGSTFGGTAAYSSRRGVEKFIFAITIVASVIFIIISLISFLVQ